MAPFEIRWQAPEFEYRPKGVSWYWLSIIIAIIILGVAVWQKNFLFGFFVVAAEILVLTWANREPAIIEFKLNEKGISLGGQKSYAYEELESFSSEDGVGAEWSNIFFQFRRRLRTPLKIKLPKNKVLEVQKVLKSIMPQVEHEHSILDTLEEFIGF